jgi:phosphotransferase system HPr (HPr) family protein
MQTIQVTVQFKEGLHARPATELGKSCQFIKSDVKLIKEDTEVFPKSILGIMSLGASYGTALTVTVSGADEEEAITKLATYFNG